MPRSRHLAVVQAGGQGSRMGVLTRERAKPALPFAGSYQLVDFPLSNLHHSGIDDVWLCLQYQADTMNDLVANGRPWDLDRTRGGLRLVFPRQLSDDGDEVGEGFAKGNADQLFLIREDLRAADPDLVLVMSADHVYRFDYADAIETHQRLGAECTIVTTTCSREEAAAHATVEAASDGRVTGFAYKPEDPTTGVIATEVFVYDTATLLAALEELFDDLAEQADPETEGTGLGDFGEHLLPWFVDRGKTVEHRMPGYWMDVGRPETYLQAHRDLLEGAADIFDASWPILTQQPQRRPARVARGATIEDSLLSSGCSVEGTVRRSVIGPGVHIERGATVSDAVIFADTVIRARAEVSWAIVDEGVTIGRGAVVGGRPRRRPVPTESITMLGSGARVRANGRVALGETVEPRGRR